MVQGCRRCAIVSCPLKGHCAAVAERGACCVLLCVACEWCVIENIMGPRRFLSANHNIQVWASGLCV